MTQLVVVESAWFQPHPAPAGAGGRQGEDTGCCAACGSGGLDLCGPDCVGQLHLQIRAMKVGSRRVAEYLPLDAANPPHCCDLCANTLPVGFVVRLLTLAPGSHVVTRLVGVPDRADPRHPDGWDVAATMHRESARMIARGYQATGQRTRVDELWRCGYRAA
jgi:hypothetical protein